MPTSTAKAIAGSMLFIGVLRPNRLFVQPPLQAACSLVCREGLFYPSLFLDEKQAVFAIFRMIFKQLAILPFLPVLKRYSPYNSGVVEHLKKMNGIYKASSKVIAFSGPT